MNKQSKITVKHYLEKKVKPKYHIENGKQVASYPLYYRITYKRKTTNIKSFTSRYMTDERLLNFLEKPEDYFYVLANEKKFIEVALLDIIQKNYDIEIFDNFLVDNIKHYFENLKDSLFFLGWFNYQQNIDNEELVKKKSIELFDNKYSQFKDEIKFYQNQFYGTFNKENSLILNLFYIKKVTGFDLEPFIYKETLKLWYVINLILIEYSKNDNYFFIDFFINYDVDKLIKINEKQNYPVNNKEIDTICKLLINNHLDRFIKEKN